MSYEGLPNTYVIGFPKCGTTSLIEYLRNHKDVFIPDNKEPFYWSTDIQPRVPLTFNEYAKLYSNRTQKIMIDGSTSYSWSKEAIPNILNKVPDAKFVLMVRDPVEMAFSWHSEVLAENGAISEDFKKAWTKVHDNNNKAHLGSLAQDYKYVCSLGSHIRFIRKKIPNKNIHIIQMKDLKEDPKEVYCNVLKFLGLPDDGFRNFVVYNSSKVLKRNFAYHVSKYFTQTNNYFTARVYLKLKFRLGIDGFGINKFLARKYLVSAPRKQITTTNKEMVLNDLSAEIDILNKELRMWNEYSNS